MSKVIKAVPWAISVLVMLALIAVLFTYQSKIGQKDKELSRLQDQYKVLQDQHNIIQEKYDKCVADMNVTLKQADARYAQLIDDANQQLHLANLPEITAKISFRKAILSNGKVVTITNTSDATISLIVEIERPSSGQKRMFNFVIDPRRIKEIGELEGWAFVPGDTLKLTQANHKSLIFTAP